jgi:hypothetical protein
MSDTTIMGVYTAQAAKSAQRVMLALFNVIKASGRTGKPAEKLCRRLRSVEEVLESITEEKEGAYFCNLNLSSQAYIHLSRAIVSTQDACERFLNTFKKWTNHSSSLYLHESDSGDFDISEKMELSLLSERLQMFKYTILMAVENSILYVENTSSINGGTVKLIISNRTTDGISTSKTLPDMDSILCRQKELYLANIDIGQRRHVLIDRREALNRIIFEIEDYDKGMWHNKTLVDELVCETNRLCSEGQVYDE